MMIPGMMNRGMAKVMKASEGKPIVVAISPDIQGTAAFGFLDIEQKSLLRYALKDYAKRHRVKISLDNCLKGTGEICWGFEAKTRLNRKPALKMGVRKKIRLKTPVDHRPEWCGAKYYRGLLKRFGR